MDAGVLQKMEELAQKVKPDIEGMDRAGTKLLESLEEYDDNKLNYRFIFEQRHQVLIIHLPNNHSYHAFMENGNLLIAPGIKIHQSSESKQVTLYYNRTQGCFEGKEESLENKEGDTTKVRRNPLIDFFETIQSFYL